MKKVEKKCDICGKRYDLETNVNGEIDTGEELISQTIKGVGKGVRGLSMDLCPRHHIEFIENTRRWVLKETTLDRYLPQVEDVVPPPISDT